MRERRSIHFPDEVVEQIFNFTKSHRDRNSLSLVCKSWHRAERLCRSHVLIGNCYALSPDRLVSRFPNLRALTLKGRPRLQDSDCMPPNWGASVSPWIRVLARSCPLLRELRFKRMVLSDRCLESISGSFPEFRALVLIGCQGFSTKGIAAITASCRHLEVLDMQDSAIENDGSEWLPESCTSLVSLNFASLAGEVNLTALERLVGRCSNLRSLQLNKAVTFDTLQKILDQAPQLVDLGIGSFVHNINSPSYVKMCNAIHNCKSLVSLAGFFKVAPWCLPAVYPVCSNLIFLNLSCAPDIWADELVTLIQECPKLQCLWILDSIGDKGLEMVASTCKELRELRVHTSYPFGVPYAPVTEKGLVAISLGCPKLRHLVYYCFQMTNAALITVAKNCTGITHFKLCMLISTKPDHSTMQPLDEGFGAIVQSCKGLKQLSLSGLLSDKVFLYIAMYGEHLEKLFIGFAGESDTALLYVLNGCRNLRKLEIRSCPFGDAALGANAEKHEAMRFLWMSSCRVTLGGCKALAKKMPSLSVEIINKDQVEENAHECLKVDNMCLYRTLDGPRKDAPACVWIL